MYQADELLTPTNLTIAGMVLYSYSHMIMQMPTAKIQTERLQGPCLFTIYLCHSQPAVQCVTEETSMDNPNLPTLFT